MQDLIEKIFKTARGEKLDANKKNSIRGSVLAFMKENPLSPQQKLSFWDYVFSPRLKPAYISLSALALVLVAGGLISAQAGSALPGDPLYSVKTGFNEKILQVLAFSDEQKTKLSMELANVRLQEAEQLAVQGKMTKQAQEQINNNLDEHVDAVSKTIEKLNSEKMHDVAQKVASDLEASLKTHSKVLQGIKDGPDVKPIIEKVDQEAQKTSDSSMEFENNVIQSSADIAKGRIAQSRLQAAQESIQQAKDLMQSRQNMIPGGIMDQLQENISLAEQKITEGQDNLNQDPKDYSGAIFAFNKANIMAKELINLVKINTNLRGRNPR